MQLILQGTLSAHYISKVERLKTGKMLYERRYLSPRPPPKISLKHDHNWTRGNDQLGSTVEHRPVGKLVQQSLGETLQAGSSKPTQFKPRIEKLSQQDRLSKFCMDAGFLTVVEIGQYFMTKNTAEVSQFTEPVACREYTLPRDEK